MQLRTIDPVIENGIVSEFLDEIGKAENLIEQFGGHPEISDILKHYRARIYRIIRLPEAIYDQVFSAVKGLQKLLTMRLKIKSNIHRIQQMVGFIMSKLGDHDPFKNMFSSNDYDGLPAHAMLLLTTGDMTQRTNNYIQLLTTYSQIIESIEKISSLPIVIKFSVALQSGGLQQSILPIEQAAQLELITSDLNAEVSTAFNTIFERCQQIVTEGDLAELVRYATDDLPATIASPSPTPLIASSEGASPAPTAAASCSSAPVEIPESAADIKYVNDSGKAEAAESPIDYLNRVSPSSLASSFIMAKDHSAKFPLIFSQVIRTLPGLAHLCKLVENFEQIDQYFKRNMSADFIELGDSGSEGTFILREHYDKYQAARVQFNQLLSEFPRDFSAARRNAEHNIKSLFEEPPEAQASASGPGMI